MLLTRAQSATLGVGSLCLLLFTTVWEWRLRQSARLEMEALRSELRTTQAQLSIVVRVFTRLSTEGLALSASFAVSLRWEPMHPRTR